MFQSLSDRLSQSLRTITGKARLTDPHGNVHFVRVRAANPGARFETGSEVLLVKRESSVFEVIAPPASLAEAR